MKADTSSQFSLTTVILHWTVALTIIGLLVVGVFMVETKTYSLYWWHKSIGCLVFLAVLLRATWRFKNGWPSPVGKYSTIEKKLAKGVHRLLIITSILVPITGFLMSSLGGYGVDMFGLDIVARNPNPQNPDEVIAYDKTIAGVFHSMHFFLSYILIVSIIIHIFGALKHHMIDKDGTLKRMLGKRV